MKSKVSKSNYFLIEERGRNETEDGRGEEIKSNNYVGIKGKSNNFVGLGAIGL